MASRNRLPQVPYKTKFLDNRGEISIPWLTFFRELFSRLGGDSDVPDASTDVVSNRTDINSLILRVEALEQEPAE